MDDVQKIRSACATFYGLMAGRRGYAWGDIIARTIAYGGRNPDVIKDECEALGYV